MKKTVLVFFLLISGLSFAQTSWSVSVETFKDRQVFSSDFKVNISDKIYFSNWTSYANEGILPQQPAYGLMSNYVNYSANNRLIISVGYRYINNYTFNEDIKSLSAKLTFKILK